MGAFSSSSRFEDSNKKENDAAHQKAFRKRNIAVVFRHA